MASRLLIAYILIALLAGGAVFAFWRLVYNSERNVRRRARRERRAKEKRRPGRIANEGPSDSDT